VAVSNWEGKPAARGGGRWEIGLDLRVATWGVPRGGAGVSGSAGRAEVGQQDREVGTGDDAVFIEVAAGADGDAGSEVGQEDREVGTGDLAVVVGIAGAGGGRSDGGEGSGGGGAGGVGGDIGGDDAPEVLSVGVQEVGGDLVVADVGVDVEGVGRVEGGVGVDGDGVLAGIRAVGPIEEGIAGDAGGVVGGREEAERARRGGRRGADGE